MGRILTLILLVSMFSLNTYSQFTDSPEKIKEKKKSDHMYNIKPWIDIPLTVVTAGFSVNGFRIIYGRDSIDAATVLSLNRNDVNSFDRPVTYNYSEKAKNTSDLFFYGSMPLPLLLYLDKNVRKDGLRVGLLYVEALGITGVFYTGGAMLADKYRPITYNSNVPMSVRTDGGNRNSFPGGHPALVATSTFFMAKVFNDYHPNMKFRWIPYTIAGGLSVTTAYLRFKAGYHFKTDLMAGVAFGALSGILVPTFHKNRSGNGPMTRLSVYPKYQEGGNTGFTALYRLGK